jgi:hypothetical protein
LSSSIHKEPGQDDDAAKSLLLPPIPIFLSGVQIFKYAYKREKRCKGIAYGKIQNRR